MTSLTCYGCFSHSPVARNADGSAAQLRGMQTAAQRLPQVSQSEMLLSGLHARDQAIGTIYTSLLLHLK